MHIVLPAYQNITPQLLGEFRNGSAEAFKTIFDSYDSPLLKYASKICLSREEAEEVVQDTFVALWENRQKVANADITPWLFTVCRNRAIKSLRRKIFQIDIAQMAEPASTLPDGLQQLQLREIQALIDELIAALPPARKKIFLLSREDKMSYQEIALELGVSVATVRNQISKALDHLRRGVSPYAQSLILLYLVLLLS